MNPYSQLVMSRDLKYKEGGRSTLFDHRASLTNGLIPSYTVDKVLLSTRTDRGDSLSPGLSGLYKTLK